VEQRPCSRLRGCRHCAGPRLRGCRICAGPRLQALRRAAAARLQDLRRAAAARLQALRRAAAARLQDLRRAAAARLQALRRVANARLQALRRFRLQALRRRRAAAAVGSGFGWPGLNQLPAVNWARACVRNVAHVHAQGVRALGAGFYLLRAQGSYLGAGLLLAALYLSACFRLVPVCLARVRALCLSVLCVPVRGAGHRNNFAGTYTEVAGTLPGDTRVIKGILRSTICRS
jgi:hypothetical protein